MTNNKSPFMQAYSGYLRNLLGWEDLERLWDRLREQSAKQWYLYAVGELPPEDQITTAELETFMTQIDELLRQEHQEDYCGIVYVDQPDDPTFIKIYDPNNLGSVCGSGFGPPPPPGWILSLIKPDNLEEALPQPGNRRRWWQRLFAT